MGSYSSFMSAISSAEGFGTPGAIPTVNNNPGDLTNSSGQIIHFSTLASGQAALQNQIQVIANGTSSHYTPSMTLSQMGQIYANGDPNWANNVASNMGLSPNSTVAQAMSAGNNSGLNSFVNGLPSWLQRAMGIYAQTGNSLAGPAPVTSQAQGGTTKSNWVENGVTVVIGLGALFIGLLSLKQTGTVINIASKASKLAGSIAA